MVRDPRGDAQHAPLSVCIRAGTGDNTPLPETLMVAARYNDALNVRFPMMQLSIVAVSRPGSVHSPNSILIHGRVIKGAGPIVNRAPVLFSATCFMSRARRVPFAHSCDSSRRIVFGRDTVARFAPSSHTAAGRSSFQAESALQRHTT